MPMLWAAAAVVISGTVVDPSGATVPGARVEVRCRGWNGSASTTAAGRFTLEFPGGAGCRLRLRVAGFEPYERDLATAPAGLRIELRLAPLRSEITVAGQGQQVSLNADANRDAVTVERSLLDNLPSLGLDPLATLGRFLDPGAGGSATLIVDGMEMRNIGVTPSAIQEIRINNNPYTAEYPRWSRRRIEVITKTAADAFHGTLNVLFRDAALNARDPLAGARPAERRATIEGSLFGPVGRGKKTSFLLTGQQNQDNLVAVVVSPLGNANVAAPRNGTFASARVARQGSERQAWFWQQNYEDRFVYNELVGETVLAEAGAQRRFREDETIFNHRLMWSPRTLSQFRILVGRYWAPVVSNNPGAPKAVIPDTATLGGAQADRVQTELHTSITWMVTHTRGRHTVKGGFNVPDWSRRGFRDETNFRGGTSSYATLADYGTGKYYARVWQEGEPRTVFIEKNVGGFIQDDFQWRKNLSLSWGLRYDLQNYFDARRNWQPRGGIAWAPDRGRKWVVRAGAGLFYERSGPQPVWDILRYDGTRLRRYVATAPDEAAGARASVHRLEEGGTRLPAIAQASAGIERQLAKATTLAVQYVAVRGYQHLRSRDANAPRPPSFGARPDGRYTQVRQIESEGRLESNSMEVTLRGTLAPKVSGLAQYVFGRTFTDTQGLNWFPQHSYAPEGEWARADTDRRHQVNAALQATPHRWAQFGLVVSVWSGLPFNVTTGRDENRDGMALERPAGMGRNTGRGPGYAAVDLRWWREARLNPARKDKSPLVTAAVDAFNVLNRTNAVNYAGALTSPYYGRAVATHPARRLQLSLRLQF